MGRCHDVVSAYEISGRVETPLPPPLKAPWRQDVVLLVQNTQKPFTKNGA